MKHFIITCIFLLSSIDIFADINYDLLTAVRWGKLIQAKKFIKKGADINFQDHYGRTPLMLAAAQEHLKILQLLIRSGANVKLRDKNNNTILDLASYKTREYLIQKGIVAIPRQERRCHSVVMEFYKMNVHNVNSGFRNQAQQFRDIYQKIGDKPYFSTCLRVFLSKDLDKHYSVGIILFLPEYGNLKQYRLAEIILKRGLKIAQKEQHPLQVSFLHVIGQLYWQENRRKKAEIYLRKAYQLAKKDYPGTIPAMPQDKQQEILQFLKIE